jgi:hypothetical protein
MLCSEPANVAVTALAADNVTLQVAAVPVQAPDQLPNVPVAVVSLSVTTVPGAKLAEQVAVVAVEQLIPAGLLVTVPVPPPASVTVSPKPVVKLSLTSVGALIVRVHTLVPEQPPPLHPAKKKPVPAVAVRVTCVPTAKLAEQVVGQLIPAGLLVIVPWLDTGAVTVNKNGPLAAFVRVDPERKPWHPDSIPANRPVIATAMILCRMARTPLRTSGFG